MLSKKLRYKLRYGIFEHLVESPVAAVKQAREILKSSNTDVRIFQRFDDHDTENHVWVLVCSLFAKPSILHSWCLESFLSTVSQGVYPTTSSIIAIGGVLNDRAT